MDAAIEQQEEQAMILDVIIFKDIPFPALKIVPKSDPRASQLLPLQRRHFEALLRTMGECVNYFAKPLDWLILLEMKKRLQPMLEYGSDAD